MPLHNSTRVTIELIDENDEIPQFVGLDENGRYPGSVAENLAPGAEVITVTAQDRDEFPDYKKVCAMTLTTMEVGTVNSFFNTMYSLSPIPRFTFRGNL